MFPSACQPFVDLRQGRVRAVRGDLGEGLRLPLADGREKRSRVRFRCRRHLNGAGDQSIGHSTHGRDHDRDLVARPPVLTDDPDRAIDGPAVGDRGAAELHQIPHRTLSVPFAILYHTLPPILFKMVENGVRTAHVLVIGSGGAGVRAAIEASGHGSVLLLSKTIAGKGGCTPMAEGGYNAVLREGDRPESTLRTP